jgi:pimeloyl-ACP methyl ester carboxylesterase
MPDATFVAIADCGHVPMEEKPDEFVSIVKPFLDAHNR